MVLSMLLGITALFIYCKSYRAENPLENWFAFVVWGWGIFVVCFFFFGCLASCFFFFLIDAAFYNLLLTKLALFNYLGFSNLREKACPQNL